MPSRIRGWENRYAAPVSATASTTPSDIASESEARTRSVGRSQAGPKRVRSKSRPTTAADESTWTASADRGASRWRITARTLSGTGTLQGLRSLDEQPDRLVVGEPNE